MCFDKGQFDRRTTKRRLSEFIFWLWVGLLAAPLWGMLVIYMLKSFFNISV